MADNTYKNNFHSARGIKPWHSKGTVGEVGKDETAEEVYKKRMEEVQFEMHPATFNVRGIEISNKVKGIFRIEGNKVFLVGETKDRYKLKQPIEYIKEFDTIGKPVETIGFLGANADKLFITWILPEIDVHGDIVELYGLVSFGFDGKFGNHLFVTSTRVVCENTHNIAISDANKTSNHGRGKNSSNAVVTTKHNSPDHLETMGHWMRYVDSESQRQVDMIKALFCKFEETPVSIDQAHGLFKNVYFNNVKEERTFIPPELAQREKQGIQEATETAQKNVDLAMNLFEGVGIGISKTVFGVYNCVTEHQNHHIVAKKNDGVDSILIGGRGKVMDLALNACKDYVYMK